jgi:hypothetical protein
MKKSTPKPTEKREVAPSLSPKELSAVPGKKALELILDSMTPARLVQSLAEEDLFWLVQDIGPEDALPILSRASNDQWQYLLDIELWHKDRLDVDAANRWFGLLLKADPQRFFIWGLGEHIELIELFLFKNIEVRIKEENESPADFGEDYFTLDDVFYMRIVDGDQYQNIREFIERLAEHDLHGFRRLLVDLAGVLPPEVEENIYRLRNVRLAEKGFLPFEEAVGIYQHLSPQSLMEKGSDVQKVMQEPHLLRVVPVTKSLLIQEQGLFYVALKHIRDSRTLEQLQTEFAGMCNQIISADALVAREKEDLVKVVRKACGYLDIGLQKLTDADLQMAAALLEKFRLDQIFRVGYGAALALKWKTNKWFQQSWFATRDFDLSFWGNDWEAMLEGLFRKRPLYYTSFSQGEEPYREFRRIEDIAHCHQGLDQIMALDHLLSLVFAHTSLTHSMEAYEPVSYNNLMLTCWARHHLGLETEVQPLTVDELKAFFQDLWTKGPRPHQIRKKMAQSFLEWLTARSGLNSDEVQAQVGATLDSLFAELEKEYGSVSLEDLDPRYVRRFLVTL